ncbi:MAG: hypothetical protein ACUVQM_05910 [Candidatus Hadarchaeaceae archaeon]
MISEERQPISGGTGGLPERELCLSAGAVPGETTRALGRATGGIREEGARGGLLLRGEFQER